MTAILQHLEILLTIMLLTMFSFLAFWKKTAVLYLITATVAIFLGLGYFDYRESTPSLAISLIIVAYSLYCFGLGLYALFKSHEGD